MSALGFAYHFFGLVDIAIRERLTHFYRDLVHLRTSPVFLRFFVQPGKLRLLRKLAFRGFNQQQCVRPRLGVHLLLDHFEAAGEFARALLLPLAGA